VYEYHVLPALSLGDGLAAAAAAQARAKGAAPRGRAEEPVAPEIPRIESTLVLLSGREEPWPAEGEFRTSPESGLYAGVKFRIEPVYQRTVEELEAKGSPVWMMFAPLAVDATARSMERVVKRLREQASRRDFNELAAG